MTYYVVIAVSNPELLLKPGMTANARIVTAERDGVLKVPLQALRFSPSGTEDEHQHRHGGNGAKTAGSARNGHGWVSEGGKLRKVKIVRGLDDGSRVVEIVSGDLHEGDQVVIDQSTPGGGTTGSKRPGGPGAGGPMGGMPHHL